MLKPNARITIDCEEAPPGFVAADLRIVGDEGGGALRVFRTAGHANHHFGVHDPSLDTVFTGDTFGLVYPVLQRRGRFAIATTSPTNFDAAEANRSIDRVLGLGARAACLTH